MSQKILIVDDDVAVRDLLLEFLAGEGHEIITASNGLEALKLVESESPDLVILDINMPLMDGFETCRRLKADDRTALIPVTMLTGVESGRDRRLGIEAGADDFLYKPFDQATLRARIRTQLRMKRITDQLERTETVIFTMARWVEMKDAYTEAHLRRVAGYGEQTARAMGLDEEEVRAVRYAGILHDIGKIGIADSIIAKPGVLSADEREALECHPDYGAEIVAPMRFASRVAPLIRAHHEHWDGCGYPHRLEADQIPIGARVIAVVDAWDAMTTDRPYRASLGEEEAIRRLREGAGSQWDARVVELFLGLHRAGKLAPTDLPFLCLDPSGLRPLAEAIKDLPGRSITPGKLPGTRTV